MENRDIKDVQNKKKHDDECEVFLPIIGTVKSVALQLK